MAKIFLDDVRNPYDVFKLTVNPLYENNEDWIIVRDYFEFIETVNKYGNPDYISFDHDLSYDHYLEENQEDIDYDSLDEKTGYDAAKWLVQYCVENGHKIPEFYVHSANPVGKKNIEYYLNNAKKYIEL
jgi:hypothetical protein